jgi:hypothetical protein
MTLEEKQEKYCPTNICTQTMLCMYIYGGSFYRGLSINQKINHRFKMSQGGYTYKENRQRFALRRVLFDYSQLPF